MANIFRMKRDIDNRASFWNYEGAPTLSETFMNFGPQRLKTGPEFLPSLDETALGLSAAQIRSSKRC